MMKVLALRQLSVAMAIAAMLLAPQFGYAQSAGKDLAVTKPTQACAGLAGVDLTDIGGAGSSVTSAKEATINNVAMCAVDGVLAPAIKFSVMLPVATWSQRYLQVGCGGLCGHLGLEVGAADGCAPLTAGGFVIAATDMGHEGQDPSFGRDAQKRVDFAYRSVHLTALTSKKLIKAFYGTDAAYSYFTGCSDGGREALMEAQRYPDDFNGIIAGAPAMLFQFQNSLHHGWLAVANTGADGKPVLLAAKLPLLHKAVVKACDALDGDEDGLLSDPRLCSFDPATLACAKDASDTSTCLTEAEVATVQKIYQGPKDPTTGERLIVGGPQYGSELAWSGVFVPESADQGIFSEMIALQALGNLVFETDPPASYSLKDLKFDVSTVELLKARHPLLDATNPDLTAFSSAGGKLILWHGWSDQHISPITTIAYQEAMLGTMGKEKVSAFERLYLLPGVNHCGDGEGQSAIDMLSAMMSWVETGTAPKAIIANSMSGPPNNFGQPEAAPAGGKDMHPPKPAPTGPAISRPVYPYPALTKYDGKGDKAAAASYGPAAPLYTQPLSKWAGADFFAPYSPAP